jgi:hypothetical protein
MQIIAMCSRESCSVLPSRLLAGLFTFLGAFLIGVAVDTYLIRTPMVNAFERSIEGSREANTCADQDPLAIQVAYHGAPGYSLGEPQLDIKNKGSEPIYFFPYDLWVRGQASPFEYPAATDHESEAFHEIEIVPGDTMSMPLGEDAPVEVILRYRHGKTRSFHSLTAHITGPIPLAVDDR